MNALRDVQMIASGRQPVGDGAVAVAQMVLDLVDRLASLQAEVTHLRDALVRARRIARVEPAGAAEGEGT